MSVEPPDRLTIMPIAMAALIADRARAVGDPDEVGVAKVLAEVPATVAGLGVAKETFGRMGVRCRPLVAEGDRVVAGDVVLQLGGPIAAMRGAAPTAFGFLTRLSSIASGLSPAAPDDPLESWAAELSRGDPVGDDGPSFRLQFEG